MHYFVRELLIFYPVEELLRHLLRIQMYLQILSGVILLLQFRQPYFLFILFVYMSFQIIAQKEFTLSLQSPPDELTILGKDNISTSINERDFAISPDGNEIYYTISTPKSTFQTIVFCKKSKSGPGCKIDLQLPCIFVTKI